jgi:hypothetical protein
MNTTPIIAGKNIEYFLVYMYAVRESVKMYAYIYTKIYFLFLSAIIGSLFI